MCSGTEASLTGASGCSAVTGTRGGVAGIKLAPGASVVFFGHVPDAAASVVTVSGSGEGLPGTESGLIKVTPFVEYPAKGRATGGVRCHKFLKGEEALAVAWVGPAPAVASSANGAAIDLPEPDGRRDGSGTPRSRPIAAVGH